eukprot:CAMPEP_0180162356 /NCGR_PEP_ID=MMETSP0986-20121125/29173_1 /TAXON_ID=697907 /ORGANISM="non described non described, Strain CCMP2293" /LENGTH=404 /DNA_ID=CAMNT_0022112821 /DNA_START=62 /DNA_END=1276 /DNA_ORIENTATION=-
MAATFAKEVAALIRNNNSMQLAQRLAIMSTDTSKKQFLDWLSTRTYGQGLSECERAMPDDWAEVVCHTVKAASLKRDGNLLDAYTHQEAAFEAFLRVFKTLSRHWCPILKVLVIDLRKLGAQADVQQRAKGQPEEAIKLEGAGRVMRKCLAQELRDDDNEHHQLRTYGALHVANQCQRVFFALNTLKHVKSLVLPPGLSVQEFPASDRVTWHYFQGRMALMESRFDQAEQDLSFAFNNCPQGHVANRRRILSYLVPVRLLLHQAKPSPTRRAALPTQALLERYKLPEFEGIVDAFRSGNVQKFKESLEEHADFFVQRSIYVLLHKLTLCVYRTLFKKAHAVVGKSQVKLEVLVAAVRAVGGEADPEQVECMLANLIHQGLVKGYIAHKQQTVVLKKEDPFRTFG